MSESDQVQLGGLDGSQRLPTPTNGAGRAPKSAFRRKPRGPRAAANRALRLRRGLGELPAHKESLLNVTARLLVHFENASDRLYREGELTKDGEVRALLPRILDLAREVRANLCYLSDGTERLTQLDEVLRGNAP